MLCAPLHRYFSQQGRGLDVSLMHTGSSDEQRAPKAQGWHIAARLRYSRCLGARLAMLGFKKAILRHGTLLTLKNSRSGLSPPSLL